MRYLNRLNAFDHSNIQNKLQTKMRTRSLLLLAMLASCSLFAQEPATPGPIALIPAPVSQTTGAGKFELPATIVIEAQDQRDLAQSLQDLKTKLSVPTGYSVTISQQ